MERANILIIAGIVATVGFLGLRFVSDSSEGPSSGSSRARPARSGGMAADTPGNQDRRGGFTDTGQPGRGKGLAADRQERMRFAGGEGGEGRGPTGSGRRSAEAILGGETSRGGAVGNSASGRRGASLPGGANIVDSLRESGGSGSVNSREQGRSELVETLAAQPSTQGGSLGGGSENTDEEGDVLLSVASIDDTDTASEKADVDEPRYGEDGIQLNPDSVLAFPDAGNVKGDAGTIAMEFTNNWAGSDESNNTLAQIRVENEWSNRLELVKNGKYLRFIITDSTGAERDISYMIDSWTSGERHQVTPTWGDGAMELYVDGRLVGRNTYSGELQIRPGTPMHLGSAFANYKGIDGVIHKTTVYGRVRTADEIANGF